MKRMKLLALAIAMLMLLTACNAVNVTEVAKAGDSITYKPEFMFYLQSAKSEAMQLAQNSGQVIAEDKDWNTVMIEGKTAAQYVKDKALESLKELLVLEAKGKEAGYTLTDADKEQIKTTKEQMIESLGGRYGYEQALKEMGVDLETFNSLIERQVYASAYRTKLLEDPSIKASEEDVQKKYNDEYVYVRHILISNTPQTDAPVEEEGPLTEETPVEEEPVDYDAQAKAEAEEILAKLAAGSDFVALMNEHSDDGRGEDGALSSDGYIMTNNGQMVPEFEEAAMKLEVGAYTKELVATDYGYHIIMRYELPTEGENYDTTISSISSELTNEKLENLINTWANELGFTINQKFVDKLKIKVEE